MGAGRVRKKAKTCPRVTCGRVTRAPLGGRSIPGAGGAEERDVRLTERGSNPKPEEDGNGRVCAKPIRAGVGRLDQVLRAKMAGGTKDHSRRSSR